MRFKKAIYFLIILEFIFFYTCYSYASTYEYIWSTIADTNDNNSPIAVSSNVNNSSLKLESTSAILIEQTTGQILYEQNPHEQLRPASVTKVMSILLIMEALDRGDISLDTPIPCSENARSMGGSQIWLDPRENLSVNDMLKAICVVSANDCTMAMAEYLAGSEEAFVQRMNARAKELGMKDTNFVNCHGIDEDGHVTSAYDISLMSRELLTKHPEITNYTTIYMDSLRDGKSELVNTNKLLRTYNGCTGLKTGSTGLALYNLSASATRDDLSLIAVVMHAPSTAVRFSEARKLLDYGFSNYSAVTFGKPGDVVATVPISKGISKTVDGVFESSASVIIKKGLESSVTQNITLEENLEAPILQGQIIGTANYSINDEVIASVNIIASEEIKKSGFFNVTSNLYSKWFNMMR